MQDRSSVELKIHRLNTFAIENLEAIISHIKGTFTLEVPCPSIGSTQSYQDVAADLLEALFIGETLAEFCKEASFYQGWDETQRWKTIKFVLSPQNITELAEKLQWFSCIFSYIELEEEEGKEVDDTREELYEFREAVSEFQDQIGLFEKEKYHFHLLVDDYFANYIIGLGEDSYIPDDTTDLSEIDREDPIQIQLYLYDKYHYIQSMYQEGLIHDFYYSTEDSAWIILSDTLIELTILEQLLEKFRENVFTPLELQEATVVATETFDAIVLNQQEAVKYPFVQITRAQECVIDIFTIKKGVPIDRTKATVVHKNLLSRGGDVLIVVDQLAQYIFFRNLLQPIPAEDLAKFARSSPTIKTYLDNLQEN